MSNIGMMEGAFFVGRKEIVDWINSTLDLNISKVEDTASGAVACQLLDIMYPGQVPMAKVNWAANKDFEYVANYKILQTCFTKLNIEKFVDVDRLIGGKYMDNLEFMQWFKRFFEMAVSDKGDYDAHAQRSKGKGGATYGNSGAKKTGIKPATSSVKTTTVPTKTVPAPVAAPKPKPAPVEHKVHNNENAAPNAVPLPPAPTPTIIEKIVHSDADQKEIANLKCALEDSRKSYSELKQDFEGLEKERDFYYEKLRDIEVLLQDVEDKGQGNELTAGIFKILYATADGFEPTEEAVSTHQTEIVKELDIPGAAYVEETY